MMDAASKSNLLDKIEDPNMRGSLNELLIDLDNAQVKYGPLDTDILDIVDEYNDEMLSEEENAEFKKALKDILKNKNTKIHFDLVFFDVDERAPEDYVRSKNWVVYPLDKLNTSYKYPVSLSGGYAEYLDFPEMVNLDLLFKRVTGRFDKYLEKKFSIPVDYNTRTGEDIVYHWSESWLPSDYKDQGLNFYGDRSFMKAIFGEDFKKVQERRRQQYFKEHPELRDKRVQMHLELIKDELARTKKNTVGSYVSAKLLHTVDICLYDNYPEYKAACLE